ncbi:MAG: FtsX-like permease family protein, partial [Pseudomonadota bacterium]|nr:FtsX-like permease family protein [Pseudomonadota bacterium]
QGVLLGQALAERLKTGLGKRIVVMSQNLQGGLSERGFKIVGIFSATQESTEKAYLFTGLHTAQTLLNMGGALSEIAFVLHNIKHLSQFIHSLNAVVPHNPISSWETLQPFAKAMFQLSTVSITLLGSIMFIAMAFGIVNTLLMAIFERTREIGLLQALGMRSRWIVLHILLESALLIGLGVVIGLTLGVLTLVGFHDGLDLSRFAAAMTYWGARKVLYLELNIIDLMIIGSTIWTLGLLASCYPAWRAARYVPVKALSRAT